MNYKSWDWTVSMAEEAIHGVDDVVPCYGNQGGDFGLWLDHRADIKDFGWCSFCQPWKHFGNE